VLTNPYSDKHMDESIDQALAMSPEEQQERMQRLHQVVLQYDVKEWANHMFRAANATASPGEPALV
jgi:glucosylglycerol-phosphate synthase